jgi:hypothetical protein
MYLKPKVQAANECLMFLVSGAFMFSTGYIYEDAGGGGISGHRFLNGLLFVLVGLFAVLLVVAGRRSPATDPSNPVAVVTPPQLLAQEGGVENGAG